MMVIYLGVAMVLYAGLLYEAAAVIRDAQLNPQHAAHCD